MTTTPSNITAGQTQSMELCANDRECAPDEGCFGFVSAGLLKCEKYNCQDRVGHGRLRFVIKDWHPSLQRYCCTQVFVTHSACSNYSTKNSRIETTAKIHTIAPTTTTSISAATATTATSVLLTNTTINTIPTPKPVYENSVTPISASTRTISRTNSVTCKPFTGSLSFLLSGLIFLSPSEDLKDNEMHQANLEKFFKELLPCTHITIRFIFEDEKTTINYMLMYPTESAAKETIEMIDSDAFIKRLRRMLEQNGGGAYQGIEIIGQEPPAAVQVEQPIKSVSDKQDDETPQRSPSLLVVVISSMCIALSIFVLITIAAIIGMKRSKKRPARKRSNESPGSTRRRHHRRRSRSRSSSSITISHRSSAELPVTLRMYENDYDVDEKLTEASASVHTNKSTVGYDGSQYTTDTDVRLHVDATDYINVIGGVEERTHASESNYHSETSREQTNGQAVSTASTTTNHAHDYGYDYDDAAPSVTMSQDNYNNY